MCTQIELKPVSSILECQDADDLYIKNLVINKNLGHACLHISSCRFFDYTSYVSTVSNLKTSLKKYFSKYNTDLKKSIRNINVEISYNKCIDFESRKNDFMTFVIEYLSNKFPVCKSLFYNCTWDIKKSNIQINLNTIGEKLLSEKKCDSILQDLLFELFNLKFKVKFCDVKLDNTAKIDYFIKKNDAEGELTKEIRNEQIQYELEKIEREEKESESFSDTDPILGKTIDASEPVSSLKDVTLDSGKVVVIGEIFKVEYRNIKEDSFICAASITDRTSSIRVKFFGKRKNEKEIKERLLKGDAYKIQGNIEYDQYEKEMILRAKNIVQWHKLAKTDNAKSKRVELHLHTKMSSMDGVSSAEDYVKRAAEFGHEAIAITDHGVVQSYPEAYGAAKASGKDIKIIYGVECYLARDPKPFTFNIPFDYLYITRDGKKTKNANSTNKESEALAILHKVYANDRKIAPTKFTDEFIVFDVETTGLNGESDEIIEIGAVRMRDMQVVERFNTFIKPNAPITETITNLTSITNEMVSDSPTESDAIKVFAEFIGNSILVAHNAAFDTAFMRPAFRRARLKFDNTYLDTLQLSRRLFANLKNYKLATLAEHFSIVQENAHRACDDAYVTALLLSKCFIELQDTHRISDIASLVLFEQDGFDISQSKPWHAVILVKNEVGLKNLYKLVSYSHLHTFFRRPQITKKKLMEHKEGLLIGSACEQGELFQAIFNKAGYSEIFNIGIFYDYFEIMPLCNNSFMIRDDKVKDANELINVNLEIIKLGDKLNKPVVGTCDAHFLNEEDSIIREIIQTAQGYKDANLQPALYYRNTEEMLREFSYLDEKKAYDVVVTNTQLIASMIENIKPIPSGKFPPFIEGADDEIRESTNEKLKEIYGDNPPSIVMERVNKELSSIINHGFAVMYIIARKLVLKSISDGYLVGSRGSVGSSLVAFLTGITEVNSLQAHYICPNCKNFELPADDSVDIGFDMPDKNCPVCGTLYKKDGYDIPFETFLGFEGDKDPDIDLNFTGDYQAKAHKHAETLFGSDYVFRAGTISGVASKTAFGYVQGYMNDTGTILSGAEVERLMEMCEGIKKTTGQHPGGIMIVPKDKEIYDFSPIQRPADSKGTDIITTHFDCKFLHECILKIDILGHDDPTILKMLHDLTGVDPRTVEIGEKNTMRIFSELSPLGVTKDEIMSDVGTYGIPEFGTKFVREMLKETRPTKISELVRISGLSHGADVWIGNAQKLISSGQATLSEAICCRDDITIYLIHKELPPQVAFRISESVRKGKGLTDEEEKIMREHNVPGWYIDSCKKISYMFPKAHAVAYVMMAFRIAWYKVNYPEAFYAAYFSVRAGDAFDANIMTKGRETVLENIKNLVKKGNEITAKEKDTLSVLEIVNEMYARGLKFCPVDLYESDVKNFKITPDGLLPPFVALPGLGPNAAANIVASRQKAKFLSKEDLMKRASIGKSVLEILEKSDCLSELEDSNQMNLF